MTSLSDVTTLYYFCSDSALIAQWVGQRRCDLERDVRRLKPTE